MLTHCRTFVNEGYPAPQSIGTSTVPWAAESNPNQSQDIFNSYEWISTLQQTYKYKAWSITHHGTNNESSNLPVLEVDSELTGRRGISLPFTDNCEPNCSNPAHYRKLLDELIRFGHARSWKYFEVRGGSKFLKNETPSSQFYTHRLAIADKPEQLVKKFSSSTRRNIKKAEKNGVQIDRTPSGDNLKSFYELQCITRKRHGLPPQPFLFFQNIKSNLLDKGLGTIITAKYQNEPIASAIFLHKGQKAVFKYGASNVVHQNLRANNLVMWQAIKHFATIGFHSIDFGRSSMHNDGLRRFKLGWGTTEKISRYYKYDFAKNQFIKAPDHSEGWHTKVFCRLPIPILKQIGKFVYAHIA